MVPTAAALEFVGAPTWAALSGRPVATEVWDDAHEVPHVRIGRAATLVVVAPATADLLARAAHGLAADLLTNTLLTARCPVLYAPAMHTEMWEHPATQANVAVLRQRGAVVLEPAVGRLTGTDTGKGRLPEPPEIYAAALALLRGAGGLRGPQGEASRAGLAGKPLDLAGKPLDLAGRRVVVTAGGTREPIDPVRYIGNRSSGKQGYAFARAAVARGASVTLIAANVTLPDPAGVAVVPVGTTEELRVATLAAAEDADIVVMAAAPADFRPARYADQKIKKTDDGAAPVIELTLNPDIAAELGAKKPAGQVLVAFAAETAAGAQAVANAEAKLARKGADLIVLNDVSEGRAFGSDVNAALVLDASGVAATVERTGKGDLADAVLDLTVRKLAASRVTPPG